MKVTASPEAQLWFDQGLNLLHDFWDYESDRAFEQSIRVDPQCAMCYWGLYNAESFYHGTAKGYAAPALAKAVSLKGHVSKRERLYIEATTAYEDAAKNRHPDAMFSPDLHLWRKLVKRYPRDTQAQIFLARLVDRKECVAILQSILKGDPNNSAANHYYIHALEAGEHPEKALHNAEILASLAPASGHMVHMPGHIFFRLGDYARAEQAFDASMQVDERYMRDQHVQPDNDWNYVHNLMYAVANLMEEGKLAKATSASAKLSGARGELESTLYIYSTRDSIARLNPRLPVALRTGNWQQVIALLNLPSAAAGQPNLGFLARQLTRFAAGMQAIDAHNLTEAQTSSDQFDAGQWRMSQHLKQSQQMQTKQTNTARGNSPVLKIMPDALLQPLLTSLSIMSLELRGALQAAQRESAEAKSLFVDASQEEKRLGYREPPGYIRPVGETEGAAMMAIHDWAAAKAAYEQALTERPKSGFPLYGIAMASENSGNASEAVKEYSNFLAAWKGADAALPQLHHARAYLAHHSTL